MCQFCVVRSLPTAALESLKRRVGVRERRLQRGKYVKTKVMLAVNAEILIYLLCNARSGIHVYTFTVTPIYVTVDSDVCCIS